MFPSSQGSRGGHVLEREDRFSPRVSKPCCAERGSGAGAAACSAPGHVQSAMFSPCGSPSGGPGGPAWLSGGSPGRAWRCPRRSPGTSCSGPGASLGGGGRWAGGQPPFPPSPGCCCCCSSSSSSLQPCWGCSTWEGSWPDTCAQDPAGGGAASPAEQPLLPPVETPVPASPAGLLRSKPTPRKGREGRVCRGCSTQGWKYPDQPAVPTPSRKEAPLTQ